MGRMIMDKKFERYSKAILELGWTTDQDGDVWYTGSNYIPESVLFKLWEASENNFNQGLAILDEMVKEEWSTDYCDGYTMKAKEFLDQYGDKK